MGYLCSVSSMDVLMISKEDRTEGLISTKTKVQLKLDSPRSVFNELY